jgi:uncharacterized membrane protein YfcA
VSPRPTLRGWRPLLTETLPFAAASVVHVVYFRTVVVITSLQAPARQAGFYATVFRVTEFAAAVGGALAGTRLAPRVPAQALQSAFATVLVLVAGVTAWHSVPGLVQ